jgi:hypothetical protein
MATMLSQVILNEIFNLEYQINDVCLQQLADELSYYQCVVRNYDNFDAAIIVYFYRQTDVEHPHLEGELRIDRITKQFTICVTYGEEIVLPAVGSWDLIIDYLTKVLML